MLDDGETSVDARSRGPTSRLINHDGAEPAKAGSFCASSATVKQFPAAGIQPMYPDDVTVRDVVSSRMRNKVGVDGVSGYCWL